ncbi:Cyclic nucleotide-gated cation channel alpha-3, partial [Fragariocoptes setiger]
MHRSFVSRDNEPLMTTGRAFNEASTANQHIISQQANNTQTLKIEMNTTTQDAAQQEQQPLNIDSINNQNNSSKRKHNKNKLTLDPSGAFCHHWSMCVSLAFLYNFWSLSYRFAFQEINNESVYAWFALDYTADVIYALDIVVGFRTGYLEDGVLQTDCEKLRQHYINCNAFYIDCFCLLPLDFLYLSIGFNSVLRCTRLVKIYRFWHYSDRTERHTNYPNVYRTFALVHYIVVIIHWNACLVHMIASDRFLFGFHISPQLYKLSLPSSATTMPKQRNLIATQSSNGQNDATSTITYSSTNNHHIVHHNTSNTNNNNNNISNNHNPHHTADSAIFVDNATKCIDDAHDVLCQYLHAFYWSTQALTLVADLPRPVTKSDYMFLLVEFIFGLFLFAAVLGHVANIVTNVSAGRREFQAKLDAVKTYMRMRRVSGPLQHKVIKWFDYLWVTQKSSDDDKSVACLPDRLKAEIAIHVHLDTLKRVEIFQNTEAGFLCELVLRLKPVLFSPGDYVCRKNEVGHEMYIVNRGRLEVVADNGTTVLATLNAGSYFGEISILNVGAAGNKRTASVRSLGYTDLFCLSKQDLWDVLKDYPAAEARIRTRAEKRLSKLDLNASNNNSNANPTTMGAHSQIASDTTNLDHINSNNNNDSVSKRLNSDLNLHSNQIDRGTTSLRSRSLYNRPTRLTNDKQRVCRHLAAAHQHRHSAIKTNKCQQSGITDVSLINSVMSILSSSSSRSSLHGAVSASSSSSTASSSSSSSSSSIHSLVPSVTPSMSLSMAAGTVPTSHWSGSSSALLAANRMLLAPSQHESRHDHHSHHHRSSRSTNLQHPVISHSHNGSLTHKGVHRHSAHGNAVGAPECQQGDQLSDQLAQYLRYQAHNQHRDHRVGRERGAHHRHSQDNSLAHRLLHSGAATSSVLDRSSHRHARRCCCCCAPAPSMTTAPISNAHGALAQRLELSSNVVAAADAATRLGTQSCEMQIAPPEVSVTGASEPASPCATPNIGTFQSISTDMLLSGHVTSGQPPLTDVSSTRSLIVQSVGDKDGASPVVHHSSNC